MNEPRLNPWQLDGSPPQSPQAQQPQSDGHAGENTLRAALDGSAGQMMRISQELDDLAWSVSIPELGRTVADFARRIHDDAQRLAMMAMIVPEVETLPQEKKDQIRAHWKAVQEEERARERSKNKPPANGLRL